MNQSNLNHPFAFILKTTPLPSKKKIRVFIKSTITKLLSFKNARLELKLKMPNLGWYAIVQLQNTVMLGRQLNPFHSFTIFYSFIFIFNFNFQNLRHKPIKGSLCRIEGLALITLWFTITSSSGLIVWTNSICEIM